MLIQAAFVAGGLVVMNQALVHSAIDDRHRLAIGVSGSLGIAGADGIDDLFDRGAQL